MHIHVGPMTNSSLLLQIKIAAISRDVLKTLLVMDPKLSKTNEFAHVFSGNGPLRANPTVAHRYGGHQFGVCKLFVFHKYILEL